MGVCAFNTTNECVISSKHYQKKNNCFKRRSKHKIGNKFILLVFLEKKSYLFVGKSKNVTHAHVSYESVWNVHHGETESDAEFPS